MLSKRVDATLGAFWNYEGVDLERRGKRPAILRDGASSACPTYNELVVRRPPRATLDEDGASRVRRFLQATRARPRARSRDDPATGVDALLKANPRPRPRPAGRRSSSATLPVFFPEDADRPFGWQDPRRVGRLRRAGCSENELLKRPPNAARALTNEFLPGRGAGPADVAGLRAAGPRGPRPRAAAERRYVARQALPLAVGREERRAPRPRRRAPSGRPVREAADELEVAEVAGRDTVVAALAVQGEHLDRPRPDARDRAQPPPRRARGRRASRSTRARRRPRAPRGAARAPARARGRTTASRAGASAGDRRRRRHVAQAGLRAAARRARRRIRRWIATARSNSISCSVIAPASASHGSGAAADAQAAGRARTARPISGSSRKRVVERPQVVVDAGARSASARCPPRRAGLGRRPGARRARGRRAGWTTPHVHAARRRRAAAAAATRRGGAARRRPTRRRSRNGHGGATSTRSSTGAAGHAVAQSRRAGGRRPGTSCDADDLAERRPWPARARGAARDARRRRDDGDRRRRRRRSPSRPARRPGGAGHGRRASGRLGDARGGRRDGQRRRRPRRLGRPAASSLTNSHSMTARLDGTPTRLSGRVAAAVPNTRSQYGRADAEAPLVVLEVVAHVQLAQPPARRASAARGGARGSGPCRRRGSPRGSRPRTRVRVVGRRARPRRARAEQRARAARDADGGITSRSGSLGWSWWTPWIIQCSRAPSPSLGLEVEDDAVQPVLRERPDGVAAEREPDGASARPAARRPRATQRRRSTGTKMSDRDDGMHAREAVQQRRLEHRRRGLEVLGPAHGATLPRAHRRS